MESITITQVNIHELEAIIEGAVRKVLKRDNGDASIPANEDILTVPQAAEFLSLSVPTIYGLLHRKELPAMKRGKRVYFKRSELLQYLEQGRRKTLTEIESEAHLIMANKRRSR